MWHQTQEHKSLHVTFAYTREVLLHVATWALTNRRIDTSKWHDTSPLTTFANKSERTLPNDILTQGRGDYRLQLLVIFASVLLSSLTEMFTEWHYVNLLATRENRDVWRVASREQCHGVHRFWWRHTRYSFSTRTRSRFTCSKTSLMFRVMS